MYFIWYTRITIAVWWLPIGKRHSIRQPWWFIWFCVQKLTFWNEASKCWIFFSEQFHANYWTILEYLTRKTEKIDWILNKKNTYIWEKKCEWNEWISSKNVLMHRTQAYPDDKIELLNDMVNNFNDLLYVFYYLCHHILNVLKHVTK